MFEPNATRHMTVEGGDSDSPRHPVLVVVSGNLLDVGRILPIGRDKSYIGREASTDLPLNDRLVSRKHLEIVDLKQTDGVFSILIRDLKSTNGTFVQGQRVTELWVKIGETIEIGAETILLFRTESFTRIQDSNLTLCMVSRDPLTGIYNRRAFEQLVEHSHERMLETNHSYSLILIDVDNFKQINDSMGHPTGDKVLKAIANMLKVEVRADDLVARIGGDEFAILLPQSGATGGRRLAERIVKGAHSIRHEDGSTIKVTLSIGVAEGRSSHSRPADVYKEADIAMYHSKQKGRDQFTIYDDSIKDITYID